MKKSLVVTFTLLLCALSAKADKFRWGDSNTSNKVKYNNEYKYVSSSYARAYLYLGEAKIEVVDKDTSKLSLEGLTYVCDATGSYSFGNYGTSAKYLESDLISSEGGQKYSIILVSLYKPTSVKAGKPIEPGQYYSISVKTGTSVAREDASGNKYAELVLTAQFTNGDCSMPGTFYKSVEPTGVGGYVCGYSNGTNAKIPTSTGGSSEYITKDNAMYYVYKGWAEIRDDGVIDFSRLTYITNAAPIQSKYGEFGNYSSVISSDQLWQDDRIDPNGGEEFTILLVTKANGQTTPPTPPSQLRDFQTNNFVAVYNVTSQKKLTQDLWQFAQITIDEAIALADFNDGKWSVNPPLFPIVFYNHVEYPNDPKYEEIKTINIPKSYLVERFPGKTDEEIAEASVAPRTEGNKCTILESYVLGLDPDDAQSVPVVQPAQSSSTTAVQLNVGNVTVNPKANADVEYGLVSSASPDFSNPTQEVEPQESPALEGSLPASGVKYYRAQIDVKGK